MIYKSQVGSLLLCSIATGFLQVQLIFRLFSRLLFTICDRYKPEELVQSKVLIISPCRALFMKKEIQQRLRCLLPNLNPNPPVQVYVDISRGKASLLCQAGCDRLHLYSFCFNLVYANAWGSDTIFYKGFAMFSHQSNRNNFEYLLSPLGNLV